MPDETAVKAKDDGQDVTELSIQRRAEPKPADTWAGSWWFGMQPSELEVAEWWSEQRDADLRAFWRKEGNDILQGAMSSMVKKFKAMNWVLEGPETPEGTEEPQPGTVDWSQRVLSDAEMGKGWSFLVGKTLLDYFDQDKGAFWELLGDPDPEAGFLGPIPPPGVKGIMHLDASKCQLTGNPEFPVLFRNPRDGRDHKLHATRVVHFADMPASEEEMNDVGFSACSRVIAASQVLLKLARYKNEKLDDLPEPGLLLLNNIIPTQWEDAKADAEAKRRRLGQEFWRNILTLIGLDPAKPVSADFVSFASLPEGFDELQTTNLYANIVALAFGVDVREFWPISSGQLGSEKETLIMHQKARGKGVGEVIAMLERAVNWHVLPAEVSFSFDFKDDEEDAQAADIADRKAATIMRLWAAPLVEGEPPPVTRDEIRQMLADNVPYFKEDFLTHDVTAEGEVSDTERRKALWVALDRKGYRCRLLRRPRPWTPRRKDVLDVVEDNYRRGLVRAEQLADFALGELMDRRQDGSARPFAEKWNPDQPRDESGRFGSGGGGGGSNKLSSRRSQIGNPKGRLKERFEEAQQDSVQNFEKETDRISQMLGPHSEKLQTELEEFEPSGPLRVVVETKSKFLLENLEEGGLPAYEHLEKKPGGRPEGYEEDRAAAENRIGVGGLNPVYGYISDGTGSWENYGDVKVEIPLDAVRENMTVSVGDSFTTDKVLSGDYAERAYKLQRAANRAQLGEWGKFGSFDRYTEAQLYANDAGRFPFPKGSKFVFSGSIPKGVKEKLSELGFEFRRQR